MTTQAPLARKINLPLLLLYGLGTTVGAGIYALIGKIAGIAGVYAPMSFVVSSIMAGFTAMSFAEMSARFPQAAGSALYVRQGLGINWLSTLVGLMMAGAGIVSAAALSNGFIGYLGEFVEVPRVLGITVVVLALGAIAAIGIAESVAVAAIITVIEIAGLLTVVAVNHEAVASSPLVLSDLLPPADLSIWTGILAGAFLAFYAYLGFEDMVDIAEEVRDVQRILPLAILLTLTITTVLYVVVMVTALMALPLDTLVSSEAPIARLYEQGTGGSAAPITAVATLAIVNGALIQMIMASRIFYGLASRDQLPAWLAKVDARTQTPVLSTAAVVALVLTLGLVGNLQTLAETTSLIMLTVFALVNLAAWRVKTTQGAPPGVPVFPIWVPLAGFLICSGFSLGILLG